MDSDYDEATGGGWWTDEHPRGSGSRCSRKHDTIPRTLFIKGLERYAPEHADVREPGVTRRLAEIVIGERRQIHGLRHRRGCPVHSLPGDVETDPATPVLVPAQEPDAILDLVCQDPFL